MSREPLCPPAKRPTADELRADPRRRVLTGCLLTAAPPRVQSTLAFAARAPQPPAAMRAPQQPAAMRAPQPSAPSPATMRALAGGVFEIIDDDDDDDDSGAAAAAAAGVSAAAAAAGSVRAAAPPTVQLQPAAEPRLPPGTVLLRSFLTLEQQHAILAAVDGVTATVPFTIPEVRHPFTGAPAFANVYMSHAGRVWDGTKKTYFPGGLQAPSRFTDLRARDAVVVDVPPVPRTIMQLAEAATSEALRLEERAFEPPPFHACSGDSAAATASSSCFTAVLNYYSPWGSISEHADSSEPSLKEGKTFPVVSLSVGDAAQFTLYPGAGGAAAAAVLAPIIITLRSGDVLLFGGASRLVRHSVAAPEAVPDRPRDLRMAPGRLNVTLRAL